VLTGNWHNSFFTIDRQLRHTGKANRVLYAPIYSLELEDSLFILVLLMVKGLNDACHRKRKRKRNKVRKRKIKRKKRKKKKKNLPFALPFPHAADKSPLPSSIQ